MTQSTRESTLQVQLESSGNRMRATWKQVQILLLLVCLWCLDICGQVSANDLTEYQSGSGASGDQLAPVTNLNITYNDTDNTIIVTWDDLVNINDSDLGYRIMYTFTALGTELAQGNITLTNVLRNSSSFRYDIPANEFSEDGVTVNVTVQACNNISLGEPESISITFDGVFAPPPTNFSIEALSNMSAITLSWDNPFNALTPDQLLLTYYVTKLSGEALANNESFQSLTLEMTNLSLGTGPDSSYTLRDLLFYTQYNVSLTAVYSGSNSSAVEGSTTTIQGAPSQVTNVALSFGAMLLTFDQVTRDSLVQLSISWTEPLEPNGVITNYNYTLLNSTNDVESSGLTGETLVSINVSVLPYELYRVSVAAITGGGQGDNMFSDLVRSPEAAPSPTSNISATNVMSTSAVITWMEPAYPNGIIFTYTLTIINSSGSNTEITVGNETMFELTGLSPSTGYSISVQGNTGGGIGSSGPSYNFTTAEDLPTAVRELTLTISETELLVMWNPPIMPNGMVRYNVTVSGVNLVNNQPIANASSSVVTSDTSYTVVHSSVPYSNYTAVVFALTSAGPGPVEVVSQQTNATTPSAVQELALNVTDSQLIVTWESPLMLNGPGTPEYSITLSGVYLANSNLTVEIDASSAVVTDTNYTTDHSSLPYTDYTVTVFASTAAGDSPVETVTVQTAPAAPSAVRELSLNITDGTLIATWNPSLMPNGPETLNYAVQLSALNLATNESITILNSSANVTDTNYNVALSPIPYSQYTAEVFAFTSAGNSPTETVTLETDEAAPSVVRDLELTVNTTHLTVAWTAPLEPNGVVSYNVTVSGVNLVNNQPIANVSSSVVTSDTSYTVVHSSIPYSNYTVTVFASTAAGDSPVETVTVQTAPAAPSAVRELSLNITDGTLIATWNPSLMPNGPETLNYAVQLSALNLATNESITILNSSANVTDTNYNVALSPIPYSQYTAAVFAFTSAGNSPTETVTLQTDEAAPSVVRDLKLTVNTTHLTVAWTAPLEPNGVISYNVTLSGINLVNNQQIMISLPSVTLMDTSYTVEHSSLPFSNYTATVTAFTIAGPAPMVTVVEQTAEAAPSPPQNLTLDFSIDVPASYNSTSGFYEGSLMLSWSEPLDSNGIIIGYNYLVQGPSPSMDAVINATTLNTTVTVDVELLPASVYMISVSAATSNGVSESVGDVLSVPEAIPSPVTNLTIVITNSSTLTITWDPPLMPNGALTYNISLSFTDLATGNNGVVLQTENTEDNRTVVYSTDLIGLEPYAEYEVTVIALTSVGSSAPVGESVITPQGASEAPVDVTTDTTNTTVTVSWSPPSDPNGVIFTYSVSLLNSTMTQVESMDITELTVEFTNLVPFSDYTVFVRALTGENGEIEGLVANDVFMTDIGVPIVPGNLQVIVRSSNSLNVTWDPPNMLNAPMVTYTVRYRANSDVNFIYDLTQIETVIDNLVPFMMYNVSVQACSTVGCSDFTAEISGMTTEDAPSPVTNLTIVITNFSTLTITWDPPLMPNGVLTYDISLSFTDLATGSNGVVLQTENTEDNRIVVYSTDPMDLEPYSQYEVTVLAMTSVGSSSSSRDSVITAQGVSEAPVNVTTDTTNTTVTVSWSPPSDPNGVIFTYSVSLLDSTMTLVDSQNVSNTTLTVKFPDLVPFSNYTVYVRALTGENGEIEGLVELESFMTDTGVPSAPSITLLNATSATTVLVEWSAPAVTNGIITAYHISYYITSEGVSSSQTELVGTITSHQLSGLRAYTNYNVSVTAVTTLVGSPSDIVIVTTQEDVPGAPQNPTAVEINSTTVNVSWSLPLTTNGVLLSYTVYYYIFTLGASAGDEQSVSVEAVEGASQQSTLLVDLREFTVYCVWVSATTGAGEGNRSVEVFVTTDPDSASPPSFVSVMVINSTAIEISFGYPLNPRGEIHGYIIEFGVPDSITYIVNRTLEIVNDMNNQSVTIGALAPFTYYVFRVAAYSFSDNQTHMGVFSPDTMAVRTNEDIPSAPQNFTLKAVPSDSSQLSATWHPPNPTNGVITNYTIYCARVGSMEEMAADNSFTVVAMTTGELTVIIEGLTAFTFYQCYVIASTSVGEGMGSNRDTIRTPEDVPDGPPQNLQLTPLSSTSINITWEAPPLENQRGILTNYTITIEQTTLTPTIITEEVESSVFLEVTNLSRFTNYTVTVMASTMAGLGPAAVMTVRTLSDVPSRPLNLSYTNDTSTSITISWSPPSDPNGIIESYTLQITDISTISVPVAMIPNVTGIDEGLKDLSVTGLLPFHTYELVLFALTDRGAGPGSEPLIVFTLEDLPTQPLNFNLSLPTSSELTASWSPPNSTNGFITAYTVYCNSSAEQAYPEISTNTSQPPVTVTGNSTMTIISMLNPYTSYDCHVTANTSVGEGEASEPQTLRTAEAAPVDSPQNFMMKQTEATQVTLSWSRPTVPNGVITMYTLSYSNDTHDNISLTIEYNETITGYIVTDLNEFTQYVFSVSASTAAGEGPQAMLNLTTAQAAPSAPPQELAVTFINSTSLSVTWRPPPVQDQNGQLLNYTLTYQINGSTEPPQSNMVSGLSATLNGLEIFTEYVVSVRASTMIGSGPEATEVGRTDSTTPAAPDNVSAPEDQVTPTSILVTWAPPTPVLGIIESYSIEFISSVHNDSVDSISANASSYNLTELMEHTLYIITVFAFTDKGRGEGATTVQMTAEHFPDEPTNFLATVLNSTAIRLTWEPPLDPNGIVTSYHLQANVSEQDAYITETGLEGLNRTLGDGALREFVLTGLHPYVQYVFRLSASTEAGEGTPTAPRMPMTPAAVPSRPVSDISATAVNATTITVSWLPPATTHWNGPIDYYTIVYSPVVSCEQKDPLNFTSGDSCNHTGLLANSASPRNVSGSPVNETFAVNDLEEFVSYTFTVAIATSAGSTESMEIGCAMTNPAAPGVAPNVTINNITNTTINIEWEELPLIDRNGIITEYRIEYNNGTDTDYENITALITAFNLTDLRPYTNYTIGVTAVNNDGERSPSAPVSVVTSEGVPEAPRNLIVNAVSSCSINISWDPPAEFFGVPGNYYITYSGQKPQSNGTTSVSNTSHTLTELVGDDTYTIMVEASTGAGRGPPAIGMGSTLRGITPVIEIRPEIQPILVSEDDDGNQVQPTTTSFQIQFTVLEEQQVNGPVDRVRMFVQRHPSTNQTIGTYFDNQILTEEWSKYACSEFNPPTGGRKKRATASSFPVTTSIGGTETCSQGVEVCNGPLTPGIDYRVSYRLYFTEDQFVDYNFPMNATFSTAPAPQDNTIVAVAAAIVVILIVVIVIIIIIIAIVVIVRRKKTGKLNITAIHKKNGSQKLIPRDNGSSNVAYLGPSDPNIVPIGEMQTTGGTPTRFATLPRANSRKIHVKNFKAFLDDMLDDSGYKFSEEYERVTEVGLDHAKEASLMAENRAKNRYTNILAYDHSRVKLSFVDDEPGSDYINACYIPGYRMRRAYIATQGPLPATFDDFWRMVWEQNSHIIVMLTQLVERGRTKCHRYWPGADPSVYGDIAVELVSEHEKEDWTIREFKLSSVDRKVRMVRHFQFTSWPDHGVPDTPIAAIDFVKTVRNYVAVNHGPMVVHCSAGVGRTGCFLALDTLLQQLKDHDWVDILGLACEMRQHRNHMIQTEAQYVFIHKSIQEVLEMDIGVNGNLLQTGFSQSGTYPPVYVNQFVDDNNTQMTDYYGEDFLSEETHM